MNEEINTLKNIIEVIDIGKRIFPLIIGVVAVVRAIIKAFLTDPIDRIFMNKVKQVTVDLYHYAIIFILLDFMLIFTNESAIPERLWSYQLLGIVCVICISLMIVLFLYILFFFIFMCSKKFKCWITRKISSESHIKIWRVYYIVCIFFAIILKYLVACSGYIQGNRLKIQNDIILSTSFSAIIVGFLLFSMDYLNNVSHSPQKKVWLISDEYGKLYPLHAFDKDTILCVRPNSDCVQQYYIIPKEDLINEKIYYGCDITDDKGELERNEKKKGKKKK